MKIAKKLLTAALALTLAISMTGCSGPDQKEDMKASAEVKAEAEKNVGGAEAKALDDILNITPEKMEFDGFYLTLYLNMENISKNKDVKIEWTNVTLDGVALGDIDLQKSNDDAGIYPAWWPDEMYFKAKAGESFTEKMFIYGFPEDCDEIIVDMDVTDETGGESGTASVTIQVSEFDIMANIEKDMEKDIVLFIEEQEAYNANGVKVTVPEQEVNRSVDFAIECNWEYGAGFGIREVYVNGELLYTDDMSPSNNQFASNEPYEWDVSLGEDGEAMLHKSASDTNEISFNMVVEDPWKEQIEEITVTLPVITKDVE